MGKEPKKTIKEQGPKTAPASVRKEPGEDAGVQVDSILVPDLTTQLRNPWMHGSIGGSAPPPGARRNSSNGR